MIASPHSTSSTSRGLPFASTTSAQRALNAPFTQHSARRSIELRAAASNKPVADEVEMYTLLLVWKTCCSRGWIDSSKAEISGPR